MSARYTWQRVGGGRLHSGIFGKFPSVFKEKESCVCTNAFRSL